MKPPHGQSRELALAVVARFPTPGTTKTRLAADIGDEKATLFYQLCAESIFRELASLPQKIVRYVFIADSRDSARAAEWIGPGFEVATQTGLDLGFRLNNAFKEMFAHGARRAIIIASDVPDISSSIVLDALSKLTTCDLVLGPSQDGGYYLIGLNEPCSHLFTGVDWGSASVLAQTLARAGEQRLTIESLAALPDIDNVGDLRNWNPGQVSSLELTEFVRSLGPR